MRVCWSTYIGGKNKKMMPKEIRQMLEKRGIEKLMPAQNKAVEAGLFKRKNLLICTPTSSGKTLIGEMAAINNIIHGGKVLYIVPLKALASEKYKDFSKNLEGKARVGISIGDTDSSDSYLVNYDLIVLTSEKLDSLLRHRAEWVNKVSCLIIDEIHLLNDASRGPTLEIIITLLKSLIKDLQIIGLSATIGNPEELAQWLEADLVYDEWRPCKLYKGTYLNGVVRFPEKLEEF